MDMNWKNGEYLKKRPTTGVAGLHFIILLKQDRIRDVLLEFSKTFSTAISVWMTASEFTGISHCFHFFMRHLYNEKWVASPEYQFFY